MPTPNLGLKNDFADLNQIPNGWLNAVADAVDAAASGAPDDVPSGTTLHIPAGHQLWLFDSLTVEGALIVEGKLRVDA